MSVAIAASPQPSTFWQRLTGTEPKTVVRETSTTTITNDPGGSFNVGTALRNGGIGAAVAGVLGGVSLLGKVALPLIGKVGTLSGLVKLAGVGGALGIATAAIPLVAPRVRDSPAAKAALTGAAVGAAAGAVLPLLPIPVGAAVGAGVGLLLHHRRTIPAHGYPGYPGYRAHPGYVPVGMAPGGLPPHPGMVPVTPNYGMHVGSAVNPYGYGVPQGYGMSPGYGMPQGYGASMQMGPYGPMGGLGAGYGYGPSMSLPMQGGQHGVQPGAAAPVATPATRPVAARATGAPKHPGAKTWIDRAGNVRQVGTGAVLRPAARDAATARQAATAPTAQHAAGAMLAGTPSGAMDPASLAAMSAMPGMAGMLPYGMAGAAQSVAPMGAQVGAAMVPAAGIQPGAMPARPTA